jgi:hydrogenase nickel incorporation protein HypA/HybF
MHEVGLMAQAVQMALERAEQNGAARVHHLTLRIGPLAGVEIDALRFAFEVVTQGTAADAAELHIEEVPIRCWCASCAREFQPADFVFRCPECQQLSDDVRQGREFDLISMEISS